MVEWKLRLGSIRLIKTITLPRVNTSFSWNIFLFLFIVHIHFRTIIFHSWFFLIFNETSISNFFSILLRWIRTFSIYLSKLLYLLRNVNIYLFFPSFLYIWLVWDLPFWIPYQQVVFPTEAEGTSCRLPLRLFNAFYNCTFELLLRQNSNRNC